MIVLKDFSFAFGDKQIFKNVNFAFSNEKVYILMGDNGSGKTSFFNILTGVNMDFDGQILIENITIDKLILHKEVAICSSSQPVNELSVQELFNFSNIDISKLKSNIFDLDFIEQYFDRKIVSLSEGERQWLFINRTMALGRKILLFDEPTAFLDRKKRLQFRNMIVSYHSVYKPLILINSHDIEMLEIQNADRVALESRKFHYNISNNSL